MDFPGGISIRQAADIGRVPRSVIDNAIRDGLIAVVGEAKENGRVVKLVNPDQVVRYLAGRDPEMIDRGSSAHKPPPHRPLPDDDDDDDDEDDDIVDAPDVVIDDASEGFVKGLPSKEASVRVEKYYKAKLAKLSYDARSGLYGEISEIRKQIADEYATVRQAMLSVPSAVALPLSTSSDEGECKRIVDAAIRQALSSLASDVS